MPSYEEIASCDLAISHCVYTVLRIMHSVHGVIMVVNLTLVLCRKTCVTVESFLYGFGECGLISSLFKGMAIFTAQRVLHVRTYRGNFKFAM